MTRLTHAQRETLMIMRLNDGQAYIYHQTNESRTFTALEQRQLVQVLPAGGARHLYMTRYGLTESGQQCADKLLQKETEE